MSATSLTDSLARLAEPDDWETVTLRVVAEDAVIENESLKYMCTCGAYEADSGAGH